MRRISVLAVVLVTALIASTTPSGAATAATSGPTGADERLYAAVRPEERAAIIAATSGRLPVYTIAGTLDTALIGTSEAGLDAPPASITGTLDLRYVNGTGTALNELPLQIGRASCRERV